MRVFLSYSRSDLTHAEQIASNLKQSGHEVFFDQHSIKTAEDFNRVIWGEIQKAELFVFLISPNSVGVGSYTLTELALAEKKWPNPENRVLPVVIESTDFADIPIYASIGHILQPDGNVPARVRAEVNSLNKRHRRAKLKRVAAIIAGCAIIGVLMVLGYREYLDRGPVTARTKLGVMNVAFDQQTFVDRAANGDLNAVKLFLTAGMDPNAVDREGDTALMEAISGSHFEVVNALIEAKVDVNIENSRGSTALNWAARNGQEAIVRSLLNAGVDTNTVNTAFVGAVENGHVSVVRLLLSREVGQAAVDDAFVTAVGLGDREFPRLLLDKISDRPKVASKAFLKATFMFDRSHKSTADKLIETFNFLLDLGASVDAEREDGFRPLFEVIRIRGRKETLKLAGFLLKKGADPEKHCECRGTYGGGWTPLTLAIKVHGGTSKESPIDPLLANGADVNLAAKDGTTPLMLAALDGNLQLVQLLLEKGANINDRRDTGQTALAYAVSYGRENVVASLLSSGADIHIGNNPLRLAVINNQYRVTEILLAKGADVNRIDSEGQTALMLAVKEGNADIVRALLAAGARTADKDNRGRTAEVFAKRGGNSEITELLRDAAKMQ